MEFTYKDSILDKYAELLIYFDGRGVYICSFVNLIQTEKMCLQIQDNFTFKIWSFRPLTLLTKNFIFDEFLLSPYHRIYLREFMS